MNKYVPPAKCISDKDLAWDDDHHFELIKMLEKMIKDADAWNQKYDKFYKKP